MYWKEHRDFWKEILQKKNYSGFVSVEMKCANYETVDKCLTYTAEVFL